MRRKFLTYLIAAFLGGLSVAASLPANAVKWEPVKTERSDTRTVVKETEFEIKAASSTIVVTSNHNIKIQVFTILGRLVNSETLPAGTSQIVLPAHGVYLVKIGGITCKVAV